MYVRQITIEAWSFYHTGGKKGRDRKSYCWVWKSMSRYWPWVFMSFYFQYAYETQNY